MYLINIHEYNYSSCTDNNNIDKNKIYLLVYKHYTEFFDLVSVNPISNSVRTLVHTYDPQVTNEKTEG